MLLRCPHCHTRGVDFLETEISQYGVEVKNPHWKCVLCAWVGYETEKNCPYCERRRIFKKLARSQNKLFCLNCDRPTLASVETLYDDDLLPKIEEVKKKKEENFEIKCPKCKNRIFSSFIHSPKTPIWRCGYKDCGWKALQTNKECKRCHNFLSFANNQFYCPYCTNPISSIEDLQEIRKKMKHLQEDLKKLK